MLMNTATPLQPTAKFGLYGIVRSFIAWFHTTWATHQELAHLHAERFRYSGRKFSDMNLSQADIRDVVRSRQPC